MNKNNIRYYFNKKLNESWWEPIVGASVMGAALNLPKTLKTADEFVRLGRTSRRVGKTNNDWQGMSGDPKKVMKAAKEYGEKHGHAGTYQAHTAKAKDLMGRVEAARTDPEIGPSKVNRSDFPNLRTKPDSDEGSVKPDDYLQHKGIKATWQGSNLHADREFPEFGRGRDSKNKWAERATDTDRFPNIYHQQDPADSSHPTHISHRHALNTQIKNDARAAAFKDDEDLRARRTGDFLRRMGKVRSRSGVFGTAMRGLNKLRGRMFGTGRYGSSGRAKANLGEHMNYRTSIKILFEAVVTENKKKIEALADKGNKRAQDYLRGRGYTRQQGVDHVKTHGKSDFITGAKSQARDREQAMAGGKSLALIGAQRISQNERPLVINTKPKGPAYKLGSSGVSKMDKGYLEGEGRRSMRAYMKDKGARPNQPSEEERYLPKEDASTNHYRIGIRALFEAVLEGKTTGEDPEATATRVGGALARIADDPKTTPAHLEKKVKQGERIAARVHGRLMDRVRKGHYGRFDPEQIPSISQGTHAVQRDASRAASGGRFPRPNPYDAHDHAAIMAQKRASKK